MLKLNQNNSLWSKKKKDNSFFDHENQALISTNETSDWSDEWDLPGPLAGRRLQSPLQLTVTPQRFVAMSRLPCDLPQRFKGALVPDVCVCWTRDIKVEVSWCLWPHGSVLYPYTGKHLFCYLKQFGWVISESSWQKINWAVSQATFRPYIHQKCQK